MDSRFFRWTSGSRGFEHSPCQQSIQDFLSAVSYVLQLNIKGSGKRVWERDKQKWSKLTYHFVMTKYHLICLNPPFLGSEDLLRI